MYKVYKVFKAHIYKEVYEVYKKVYKVHEKDLFSMLRIWKCNA